LVPTVASVAPVPDAVAGADRPDRAGRDGRIRRLQRLLVRLLLPGGVRMDRRHATAAYLPVVPPARGRGLPDPDLVSPARGPRAHVGVRSPRDVRPRRRIA